MKIANFTSLGFVNIRLAIEAFVLSPERMEKINHFDDHTMAKVRSFVFSEDHTFSNKILHLESFLIIEIGTCFIKN